MKVIRNPVTLSPVVWANLHAWWAYSAFMSGRFPAAEIHIIMCEAIRDKTAQLAAEAGGYAQPSVQMREAA